MLVHIRTVLSCEAEAMYVLLRRVGDQATSRTQSAWPDGRVAVCVYVCDCVWGCAGPEEEPSDCQILTALSQPPVTKRRVVRFCWAPSLRAMLPGRAAEGAQETALAPVLCAWKTTCCHWLLANSSTLMLPSVLAQARRQPRSAGDQAMELTEAVWMRDWWTSCH